MEDTTRFFDSSSRFWEDSAEKNLEFLVKKRDELNKILKNEFLTYNYIYRQLDLSPLLEEDRPFFNRYTTLGIFDPVNIKFVNGYENVAVIRLE